MDINLMISKKYMQTNFTTGYEQDKRRYKMGI